jgi:uncharacterized integral membrane protein
MDERVFKAKVGCPIPAWDLEHTLSVSGNASPEIADSGTVFRLNSTYMDVSDQPHMMRQWYAGGTLVAFFMAIFILYGTVTALVFYPPRRWNWEPILAVAVFVVIQLVLAAIAIRFGHDEFFWLQRRPIRFNRITKKIYAARHRRYRNASTEGDICWEIPWDERSVFCVHKGPTKFELGEHFHIRCYQLDDKRNVIRAFAIGRAWQGIDGMRDLLAQWNYWCAYMNSSPKDLPPPLLYLSERENVVESFLCCLYELGFNLPSAVRIIFSPFVLMLTSHRLMSMWTCRDPIWPAEILDASDIPKSDSIPSRSTTPR